jgi:hypothetical protein
MLKGKLIFSIIILVCFFGSSFSQSATKVGVGVAIIDLQQLFTMSMTDGVGANATITVPIIVSPAFRLEPEAGYFSASRKVDYEGFTNEEKATSYTFGVGLFGQTIKNGFSLYFGGRVGYMIQKQKEIEQIPGEPEEEEVETVSGFYIAPAIGGERNLSDYFSIGAEAQIVYASMKTKYEPAPEIEPDISLSLISTRALIFFRFYF